VQKAYFVRHWRDLAGQQGLLGQLWKEYSLSDSRYLTQDPSVLCLEVITVVRFSSIESEMQIEWKLTLQACLGSTLSYHCHHDFEVPSYETWTPDNHIDGAPIRRGVVLCHEPL
jgi:hypothetical protein